MSLAPRKKFRRIGGRVLLPPIRRIQGVACPLGRAGTAHDAFAQAARLARGAWVCVALTAVLVMACMLACVTSAACLAAF